MSMTIPGAPALPSILGQVEERVLWLSTSMIDHANRVRPNPSGLKVGGHQASSASMTTIMTALWFDRLTAEDRVSVKPHASPVLHAINYLLGELGEEYLTTLRSFGGLQSYPSRSKDPDPVDYATGSVGIGATAPIWGALARRYINAIGHPTGTGRQYSLVGDAELDEGAVWEAIVDPMVAGLGEVCWIVDLNRQSLDRIVPQIAAGRLQAMFAAAGWQVLTAKYGTLLTALFDRAGGESLRRRLDEMPNQEYQRLLRCTPSQLRERLIGTVQDTTAMRGVIDGLDDATLTAALRNLGGHDFATLGAVFDEIDDARPTVIFAYTIKGYGLATEGHPQNHSSMLSLPQLTALAQRVGVSVEAPWQRFDAASPAGRLCADVAARLCRDPHPNSAARPDVPSDLGRTPTGTTSTQAALGRTLLDLTRQAPAAAARIVTVSPDVASSTNLGGWINKVGVWSADDRHDWFADDPETILHWRERATGQHIELGIAETNLVGLIGELGATWSRWGQPLLPIGVLYDPFVERALEPWSFGIYAGGQSILVGTPAGVTLAPEGGAHQSIKTPSIGLEQPGCVAFEPAFAIDLEWTLLACLDQLGRTDGRSAYLRLSSRPVDQALAAVPADPAAREHRRRSTVAGAYLWKRSPSRPDVTIAAMGALMPEARVAGERLAAIGIHADIVCVTSPGLLFEAVAARAGQLDAPSWVLNTAFPADRMAPLVTVLDGHPHTLAFLAGIHRTPARHLGVTRFGQSGDLDAVYRYHRIDADSIVAATLDIR
ncbi:MAG TPA: pyruvate dehydrogenase [Micromonosporaceae bacterium]